MDFKKLYTLKTSKNTKSAQHKWKNGANCKKGRQMGNYALLTGKINNIVVIDIDLYKTNKPEYEIMNVLKEYNKDLLNTYTVHTPRGGLHFYFKYDADIKTSQNDKYNIDVRSDNAYIMGVGSSIDGNEYKVINDVEPVMMDPDIKGWIMDNLYTAKKSREHKSKHIKTTKINNKIDIKYNLSKRDFKEIVKNLPAHYWTMDDNGFLKYTTFMKYFNLYELWDKTNKAKPNYNEHNNINNFWNTATLKNVIPIIDKVLYDAGNGTDLYKTYAKYRPIPINKIEADTTINNKYLPEGIIDDDTNYIIKSDTGTGKTTLFKKYIKGNNQKFISIVSRVSLANEQYKVFGEYEIDDIKHYGYDNGALNNYSVVIQLDSLKRLYKFDFSEYVIFLDEANSIIHHLITSPTLNDKRALVYKIFVKILREAKQVLCMDADINDATINFLRPYVNFTYINNTHKHNKGIEATEIMNFKLFIEQLKTENKYIVACDSATMAETIYNELNKSIIRDVDDDEKDIIKLITADTNNPDLDLDKHNKIIFSPKILYGLDSIMIRPVYCYYKEHTINPTAFLQQINRNRNITHLYYTFEHKKYNNVIDTYETIKNRTSDEHIIINRLYELEVLLNDREYKHFLVSYIEYEYREVCYKSNKFSHFILLLQERGFKINNNKYLENDKKERKERKTKIKEAKNKKKDEYDVNDHKNLQRFFNIQGEEENKYKDFFIDPYLRQQHINIYTAQDANESRLKQKVQKTKGTQNNIINSNNNKILFFKRLKRTYNITDFKVFEVNATDYNNIDEQKHKILYEEYRHAYKVRFGNFDTLINLNKCIIKMYKSLFNNNIIKKTRHNKRMDGKHKTIYTNTINEEWININNELYEHRRHNVIVDPNIRIIPYNTEQIYKDLNQTN